MVFLDHHEILKERVFINIWQSSGLEVFDFVFGKYDLWALGSWLIWVDQLRGKSVKIFFENDFVVNQVTAYYNGETDCFYQIYAKAERLQTEVRVWVPDQSQNNSDNPHKSSFGDVDNRLGKGVKHFGDFDPIEYKQPD